MITEYIATSGTAYFAFATNDPADGAADDADSTPSAFVRECGATASDAPITTGVTVSLLSNASYPLGCYEVAVAASTAGLTAGGKYTVYVSATVNTTTSVAAIGQIVVQELLTGKDLGLLYESTVSTVNSQTSFDCADTINTNDNWIGQEVIIEDVTNGDSCVRRVTDVVAASDRIIIDAAAPFTVATSDKIRVRGTVHPVYALNTYDPPTRTELTTDTNTILDKMLAYFQLALRKDAFIPADRSTELAAINNDEGSGAGAYSNQTDSLEAVEAGVNVEWINGYEVTGDGSGTKWAGNGTAK